MAVKEVRFSEEARHHMVRGVNILANAVKVTLGPKGRNALLEKSFEQLGRSRGAKETETRCNA